MNKTANSKLLMTKFRPNPSPRFIDRRNRCVTLPWQQNFWISTNPGPANMTCMTFLCMTLIRNETGAHTFLPSFDNANCLLCQERWLRLKFYYHGNVTSNVSSLLCTLTGVECGKGFDGLLPIASCYVASYLNIESRNVCYSHGSKTKV